MAQTVGLEKPSGYQRYIPMNVLDVLKTVATDPNYIAREMEEEFETTYGPGVYFRFNVEQGMQGITLEKWEKLGKIMEHTNQYLKIMKVNKSLDELADTLIGRGNGGRKKSESNSLVTTSSSYNIFETGQLEPKCHFMVPPLKCDYFIGEFHMVSWFKANKFHEGKPTEHGPIKVALVGPGGVGKTQDILEFVHYYEKSRPVYWIHADSSMAFDGDHRKLAALAQIPDLMIPDAI
ncbi:Similar to hypothetical protein PIIN_01538 [Piriformospora indica DSM 11827]; acc. no. CCA67711 [Pyronema omphalodes CBS 100304]|uniref:Uncharacterized protein n=1 Tax=Pyronema omphalodes (strain CBS 100304) TaxID=1076935 RepID=U4LSC0_PYROM|nr:Similar to hypothetical protein PIIN_01538 [Piriformospora indica DSM 11827]; acc. no. CCA67711 [Pyronema omphalodes CBS 100304]